MKNKRLLSSSFEEACGRLRAASTELYENLHTTEGSPLEKKEAIKEAVTCYMEWVEMEIDYIKTIHKELTNE